MKISYFVYLREEQDSLGYLKKLTSSDFFSNNDTSEVTIYLSKATKDINKIKNLLKSKCNSFIIYSNEAISINDAFYKAVEHMEGDVCLLLDSAIKNFSPLIKKYFEKHEKGARIVRVCRRYDKKTAFAHKIWQGIYNFFCKMFASKTDEGNVLSLGLVDRYMLDLMKALPQKRCLLKNTSGLYDVNTATIYVDDKKLAKDTVTKQKTEDMRNFIISTALTPILIMITISLNIFISLPPAINATLILLTIFSIIISCFSLPKHIFMCRNYPLNVAKVKVEKIEKK